MLIHAGTSGALDDFPTAKIGQFEKVFLNYMTDTHPEVGKEIRDTKALSDAAKAKLEKGIATVKGQLKG
jgi:F-type H+-transporting ATPase subunit alpha